MSNYALLTYTTENLGDDIQSLAADQFLPRIDFQINREQLAEYRGDGCKLILNGWFAHTETALPPPPHVNALPISMHWWEGYGLSNDFLRWCFENHPIGCRGRFTIRQCESLHIPAYLSGCLTTTFPQFIGKRKGIICVDVPANYMSRINHLVGGADTRTHFLAESERDDADARLSMADCLLDDYRHAELVVTTRLHCALPCYAFGTPCILLRYSKDLDHRLEGLEAFVNIMDVGELAAYSSISPDDYYIPSSYYANILPKKMTEACLRFVNE